MPEYHLDSSLARETAATLDSFTLGYIEAAMFTLTDTWYECDSCEEQFDEYHDGTCPECKGKVREHTDSCDHLGLHDIAPEAIAAAKRDCAMFQEANRADLDAATDEQPQRYDAHHGHDFWLTRNGHGAGFWDRGYSDALGERLTQAAEAFGGADWYVGDDGMVYEY